MFDCRGWIVRSTAGHDKGAMFCVTGVDERGAMLLLADGKRRKLARPKRKKLGHVEMLEKGFEHPAIHSLQQGEPVSDRALRRALAAFKEGITLGER